MSIDMPASIYFFLSSLMFLFLAFICLFKPSCVAALVIEEKQKLSALTSAVRVIIALLAVMVMILGVYLTFSRGFLLEAGQTQSAISSQNDILPD